MAENPTGLTTEQLLMELGKVVLGLGRKIDSLGDKMDAIHSVLSEDIAPALKGDKQEKTEKPSVIDMTPLLEKLDELKVSFHNQSTDKTDPSEKTSDDVSEKLMAIEKVLSDHILPAIKGIESGNSNESFDVTPIIEKFDNLLAVMTEAGQMKEVKPLIEKMSDSLEKLPQIVTDKFKEIKSEDTSNPMETVEQKISEVCSKLDEIFKVAEDRQHLETLSEGISQVKEQLIISSDNVLGVVKEVPSKIDEMGENLTVVMKAISDSTESMLEKTEKNMIESQDSLKEIKVELESGLKNNTELTSQMVNLTAKFADKAEQDKISDLNTRAIGHFNRGEYTEAETLFSQALNISPEDSELLCNTAHLKSAMEHMDEAEQLFRKALEISPDLEPAVSGLGLLMVGTDRAEEAIEFLKNVVIDSSASIRTTIAYSRALTAVDKHDKAVEILETALQAAPDNNDLIQELASYGYEKDNK